MNFTKQYYLFTASKTVKAMNVARVWIKFCDVFG